MILPQIGDFQFPKGKARRSLLRTLSDIRLRELANVGRGERATRRPVENVRRIGRLPFAE